MSLDDDDDGDGREIRRRDAGAGTTERTSANGARSRAMPELTYENAVLERSRRSGESSTIASPGSKMQMLGSVEATSGDAKPLKINQDLALYRARKLRNEAGFMKSVDERNAKRLEAIAMFEKAMSYDVTDGRAYCGIGQTLVQMRRLDDARAIYQAGCDAKGGDNAYLWVALAVLEEKAGNIALARKYYDAATAADGETATANVVADAKREEVPVDVESVESVIKEKKRRKKSVKKAAKKPVEEEEFKPYDPELGEGESAIGSIHEAIDDDDMEELEDLLRWKPNLREKCQKLGETRHYVPIMKAAFLGNARAMDLLIDYGANVNEIDAIGYTVLMRSVLSKCTECVRILVEAGAVVNYVQKTPMMDLGLSAQKLAMLMGEREIAEILRNAGADELETGAEKKRRLQKEGAERFKEHVEAQGIDVDIDKLLNTTVDDLNVKNSQSGDVVVNVNGTNATMTHDETKDYRNLEEKIAQAKLKAEAEARAKEACASDAGDGSCAFDPTTKDEL